MLGTTNVAHCFLGCQVLCFWKMYKRGWRGSQGATGTDRCVLRTSFPDIQKLEGRREVSSCTNLQPFRGEVRSNRMWKKQWYSSLYAHRNCQTNNVRSFHLGLAIGKLSPRSLSWRHLSLINVNTRQSQLDMSTRDPSLAQEAVSGEGLFSCVVRRGWLRGVLARDRLPSARLIAGRGRAECTFACWYVQEKRWQTFVPSCAFIFFASRSPCYLASAENHNSSPLLSQYNLLILTCLRYSRRYLLCSLTSFALGIKTHSDEAKRENPETEARAWDFSKQDGEDTKQRTQPKEWLALKLL